MANVPIVTEVTKAQFDALVAANGLNEGLQYKVTDKGLLLTATGINTFIYIERKYRAFTCLLTQTNIDEPLNLAPTAVILSNELDSLPIFTYFGVGNYRCNTIDSIPFSKICFIFGATPGILWADNSSYENGSELAFGTCDTLGAPLDGLMYNVYFEIRVYDN